MATKTITSDKQKTSVGSPPTNLWTSTKTEYETDDAGKILSSKTTLVYYDAPLSPGVDAATTTDGGKTWAYNNKPLSNVPILGKDAQKSLQEGALKTNTSQAIQSSAKSNGLTTEQQKAVGGLGQNTEKVDLTAVNNSLFGTGEEKGSDIGLPGNGKALTYPIDMSPVQDRIEFRMIRYSPKGLGDNVTEKDTNGGISGFKSRRNPYTVDTLGTVFLPIQNGIMDNNTVSWGQGDISPFEAAAAKIFLDGLKNGVSDAANTAEETAKNAASPANKGSVKTAVAAILTNSAIGKPGILARTTGAIINPNVELLFNGPLLRPFTFTFKMSGRSKEEADEIKKIIYFFKKGMAVKQTNQGLFLKAPNTFTIKYKHGAKDDHPGLNLIKECALTLCNVNYTPDGYYSTHADGNLIAYEMQLQFSELEPIYYDDYDGKSDIGY
jgi:hypothetical protein